MVTERWALERLPWKFVEVFWCEKGSLQRKFIRANGREDAGAKGFVDVMSEEFLNDAPPCDLLLAGFPCQPFSIAGNGAGLADSQGRGVVVNGILRYVAKHKPRVVMLENVKGLVARHRAVLDKVVAGLERLGYCVSWKVLDMNVHGGVPCRRSRVYIVAILNMPATEGSSTPARMVWPLPVPCADLSTIFDDTPKLKDYSNYPVAGLCKTMRCNLTNAVARVKAFSARQLRDPTEFSVIADLGGSKTSVGWGISPCLTASRGHGMAFWSIQHGRILTVGEMCKLQGLDPARLNMDGLSPNQMGSLLGNGFACTVIARVIAAAIQAAEQGPAIGGPPQAQQAAQPQAGRQPPATGSPATASRPATGGNPPTHGRPATGGPPQAQHAAQPQAGRQPLWQSPVIILKRRSTESARPHVRRRSGQ